MNNQILLDYIRQQLDIGASAESIKYNLLQKGWDANDVEAAFGYLSEANTEPYIARKQGGKKKKILFVITIIITVAIIIGVSALIFFSSDQNKQEASKEASIVTEEKSKPDNPELVIAEKLSTCTPYKTSFANPLSSDVLEKEIIGVVDEKCVYVEQMPNNGRMECRYNEEERAAVSQYYKDIAVADSYSTNVDIDNGETAAKYKINGKEVENPLQEALDKGSCVVVGY